MVKLKIELPRELEKEVKEFPEVNWSSFVVEAIRVKAFELQLSKSKELQRAIFEVLASKSKLTKKDALELGRKVNEGMLKELKEKGLA